MSTLVKKSLITLCCISALSLSGCGRLPADVAETMLEVIARISGKLIAQAFFDSHESISPSQQKNEQAKSVAKHNTSDVLETTDKSISVQELEDAKKLQAEAIADTENIERNGSAETSHPSANDPWLVNHFDPMTDVTDVYAYIEALAVTNTTESKEVGLALRKEITKQQKLSITDVKIEHAYQTRNGYAYMFTVKDRCLFVEAGINNKWRTISPTVKAC